MWSGRISLLIPSTYKNPPPAGKLCQEILRSLQKTTKPLKKDIPFNALVSLEEGEDCSLVTLDSGGEVSSGTAVSTWSSGYQPEVSHNPQSHRQERKEWLEREGSCSLGLLLMRR